MTSTESPTNRYRIAEIARLSGFSPSALRYYEHAGVLAPPERTEAGYRTYTGRDLERLRLIARAKDLGCTLDEITDLVQAWDDGQCGPVKHRLRSLVDAKVRAVDDHLAEQTSFAAQLRATAAALAERPLDGPCDDTCGCTTEADVPIACSLSANDMGHRVDEWRAVLAHATGRSAVPAGVRLVLGPDAPVAEIARLAAAEHACCSFFAFTITIDDRGTALEVTAPAEAHDVLTTVFGSVA